MARDASLWLGDMASFAAEALALTKGRGRGELETDRGFELQLTFLILRVGEAACHVPREVQSRFDLPWSAIVAMRNRLVHAYFEVDHDLLWRAVHDGLPPIVKALKAGAAAGRR